MNVFRVRTSLYGISAKVHDAITMVEGSFDKTYNNILVLQKSGVPVSVACTVMNTNTDEIVMLKQRMNELKIDISFDYKIIPSRKDTKNVEKLMITKDKFNYFFELGIIKKPKKIECRPASYRIGISYTGDIYSCDSLRIPIGNIKKDNLMDALAGEKVKEILRAVAAYNPDDCKKCRYEQYCTRCPGFSWRDSSYANVHHKIQCVYAEISCE